MIRSGVVISGKYKIIGHVDSGGMSDIYKAYCFKSKKIVALKFQKEIYENNKEMREVFRKEAETFKKLNSKYIVGCVEVGQYNGSMYIVMDYIEGQVLKKMIEENGPFSVKDTVEIGRKILRGLGHAHQKNIVHNDLKPQNIIMKNDTDPLLIDFGIAHSPVDAKDENEVIGSVYYFSPEQAKAEHTDKRSDIYSFGVMLYEMCTGKLPFVGDDPLTIALMHVHQKPKAPIELNPDIPESLNRIILKALEKEPDKRYQNALEVLGDLNRVFEDPKGEFVKQRTEKRSHWLSKKSSRIFLYCTIALVFLFAIISGWMLLSSIRLRNNNTYMPNLTGKDIMAAEEQVAAMDIILVKNEVEDNNTDGGVIISHEPEAGTVLKKGQVVVLNVSGPGIVVEMPEVTGLYMAEAKAELDLYDIGEVNIKWQVSDDAAQNEVVAQYPLAAEMVKTTETVTLTVNTVKDKYVELIPNVIGLNIKEALLEVSGSGFSAVYLYEVDKGSSGIVLSQYPGNDIESFSGPMRLTILNRGYEKYVAVIPLDAKLLAKGHNLAITADENFDGITAEMILYEKEYSDAEEYMDNSNGTVKVYLYRQNTDQNINVNTTIYIDGTAVSKVNTVFYKVNE